jgi:hypothetical protein
VRFPKRNGSILILTLIVMMVVAMLGSAFLTLAMHSLVRGRGDLLRATALNLAEAGAEVAVQQLRHDAGWRPNGSPATVTGYGTYTLSVATGSGDNAGKFVIDSTGVATITGHTVRRRLRLVLKRTAEDLNIWNNVIFAGTGQSGKSINGNVRMRGSVSIMGNGEPYTDSNGNGHRDSGEPYTDVNGSGAYDAPLTSSDVAIDVGGTADIGNNYDGMPSTLTSRVPALPTRTFGGETVSYIDAKLRVKHGRVDISGSASVGYANATGGTPPIKETMEGSYVTDGFGGNKGAASVFSDNGTSNPYDVGELYAFPALTDAVTVSGSSYASHAAYLDAVGLHVNSDLNIDAGTAGSIGPDGFGNCMRWDSQGNITINGIVRVNGNITFGPKQTTFTYRGRGTVYATGNIDVHADILSVNTFCTTDVMGFVAGNQINLATGGGDAHLNLMGAFYAQNKVVSAKQNEIAGTFVSNYFEMTNVPHMYQVPSLYTHLPPGMPGSSGIQVIRTTIDSWRNF